MSTKVSHCRKSWTMDQATLSTNHQIIAMGHLVAAHLPPYIHMAPATLSPGCRLQCVASHDAESAGYFPGQGELLWAINSIHSNAHSVRNRSKLNMTGSDMKRLFTYLWNDGFALQTAHGPSTAKLASWYASSVVNQSQAMAISIAITQILAKNEYLIEKTI